MRISDWSSDVCSSDLFNLEAADNVMHRAMHHGSTIYSAAYIMPMPSMGSQKKHSNHLRLLEKLMKDGIAGKILAMRSLRELYELLVSVESFGPFLAFQDRKSTRLNSSH